MHIPLSSLLWPKNNSRAKRTSWDRNARRMRERVEGMSPARVNRTPGSVRETPGNRRPDRDHGLRRLLQPPLKNSAGPSRLELRFNAESRGFDGRKSHIVEPVHLGGESGSARHRFPLAT
jgi:hypothetical protein